MSLVKFVGEVGHLQRKAAHIGTPYRLLGVYKAGCSFNHSPKKNYTSALQLTTGTFP